jgi:hypothetical protein
MVNPQGNWNVSSLNQGMVTVADESKIFNHSAFGFAPVIKLTMTLGASMIEDAKITGITPAELIFIGKKLAFAYCAEPDLPAF